MRYFRYKNTDKSRELALKAQYETLTIKEKRLVRKEKRQQAAASVFTIVLFFLFLFAGFYLLAMIPEPDHLFLGILAIIVKVVLGFLLCLISLVLTALCTEPIWNKIISLHTPSVRKEFFSKACAHLREYYGLQSPYIITKCFDSSDTKFKNHDVCIFVIDGELRITTDLVNGFLHGERDLGCYAFHKNELTIKKLQRGSQLILELTAENTVFLLGYRTKRFVEQNFLSA